MSSPEKANVTGADVPIVQLTPLRTRTIHKKNYNKLLANIKTVGLIEPLCVCQEGKQYFILDGYIRYTVFLELGIDTVPCLVLPSRDLYTPNRQVNHLSPREENRMLRKALEKLDERTIAQAFGVESLESRLKTSIYRELHPQVAAELESNHLTQAIARELAFVQPKRQLEIVASCCSKSAKTFTPATSGAASTALTLASCMPMCRTDALNARSRRWARWRPATSLLSWADSST
jgi:ParB family transcriptional regulator, chromosome partitioning protein